MINRRSFLQGTSALMAHASFPGVVATFLASRAAGAAAAWEPKFLSRADVARVAILVDLIIPETDSPAASAAGTHEFIDAALVACATPIQQATFRRGLDAFVSDGFESMSAQERIVWLQRRAATDVALKYDESFFKILKDYTLTGYFHSEIGATQALAYERVPGGYQGDIALGAAQKAWVI
jgi:hypothetical protein